MDDKNIVAMFGIGCVTTLEVVAMFKGIDSNAFGIVVAAVSGIIGLVFGVKISKRK